MLQKFEMSDQLYNPINHFTQTELMEKFNLAFYEAQNLSKSDILSTFNETINEPASNVTDINEADDTNDNYLIDYLISNSPVSTPNSEVDLCFDFNDFVVDFDQNVNRNEQQVKSIEDNFDTETFTTDHSQESDNEQNCKRMFSQFFVPPPLNCDKIEKTSVENLDFHSIGICEELTSGSFDLEDLPKDFQDLEESACDFDQDQETICNFLLPFSAITKNNVDFNNFLRNAPADNMNVFNQDAAPKSDFGHLIGTKCINNNFVPNSNGCVDESNSSHFFEKSEDNHMVLPQNEALLNDDPLLSSSNIMYAIRSKEYVPVSYECENSNDCEEVSSSTNFQCRWERCYQVYESQYNLVKHIEKCHVELKRGEEFTCYWENCPRKTKAFNARYKLLIHMRVHSGEKPNKCPFKGCDKAFSRLENLKIHQRSHTGERPYLCQFSSCTKSFSNSSDRAKHQRTHFDTKPYACQVVGCTKKYTDPSSLRKHVKNHTYEEQMQIKKKTSEDASTFFAPSLVKKYFDPSKQKAIKTNQYITNSEHSYSSSFLMEKRYDTHNVKQDLKNKLCEKSKQRRLCC